MVSPSARSPRSYAPAQPIPRARARDARKSHSGAYVQQKERVKGRETLVILCQRSLFRQAMLDAAVRMRDGESMTLAVAQR